MNKKAIMIIPALFIFLIFCSGCEKKDKNNVPEHMTPNAYENGLKALEIIDSFLENSLSRENAIEKLNFIYDEITYTADEKEEYYKASSVKVSILSLSQKLNSLGAVGLDTGGNRFLFEQAANSALEDIKEARNRLAELLEIDENISN